MSAFKDRLKKAMDDKRLRPGGLSDASGVLKSSISMYLTGDNEPNRRNLKALAEALSVTEDYLLGYDAVGAAEIPFKKILPTEFAKMIGKSPEFVREWIRRERQPIIGSAFLSVKGKWVFHISPHKAREYVGVERFNAFYEKERKDGCFGASKADQPK
jgi:transcriptional regulator with XRE-family HTH domain